MRPQAVFFDIDETLFRKADSYLPASVPAALRQLHQRGILTAIATGRSPAVLPAQILTLAAEVGIDLLVCINGQYCTYHGKVLSAHPLNSEDLSDFFAYFRRRGWYYGTISEEKFCISGENEAMRPALHTLPYSIDPDYYQKHPVYQAQLFITAAEEALLAESELFQRGYKTVRWHEHALDILPEAGSKARGIQAVCAALGIDLAQTMAFGDEVNDIEMFESVGFGVAMGNACPQLLAVADYVTGTVEEHGIYNALSTLGVIDSALWK